MKQASSIGSAIAERRKALGMSQAELAKHCGFRSSQIISSIEKGSREVKASELTRLASSLRLEMHELIVPGVARSPVFLWRQKPAHAGKVEAMFCQRCRRAAHIERLNHLSPEWKLPVEPFDFNQCDFEEASRLAEKLRRLLALGETPAVELFERLEQQYHVKIFHADLEEGSAAAVVDEFGAAVLLNANENPWRRNFSLAHELFHLVTWDSTPTDTTRIFPRMERCANVFAASLLLPRDPIVQEFDCIRDGKDRHLFIHLVRIARQYHVSTESLLWRLLNLGLITEQEKEKIESSRPFKQLDRASSKISGGPPAQFPLRYVMLAFEAYVRGDLSKGRLAEYLDTSLIDLDNILKDYGLDPDETYETTVNLARRKCHH